MTKLQKARKLLLKQMQDIEQGKLNEIECAAVINVSDDEYTVSISWN